ncbi:hypothetical protein GCM10022220_02780 [Actinocatenispora rupis]|uniref:hypothetical protein n=1 Tax=Actinocatenispora rupis TaxID=519421 RepID=UPI0031E872EB
MSEASDGFRGRHVALLSAGVFEVPTAFRRISAAIADGDFPLVLRAIDEARSVLDETARLAWLSMPEGAASGGCR